MIWAAYRKAVDSLKRLSQDTREKINLSKDENSQSLKTRQGLENKISRYIRLKVVLEAINKRLDLDAVSSNITEAAFALVSDHKGTGLLYLADNQHPGQLQLFKTRKENSGLVIKAKEGDIFDHWVVRHNSPLLVEDVGKDFRFDADKIDFKEGRGQVSSLIITGISAAHKFLGVLRLEHPAPGFFSQDDLRFLAIIGDIAAVALENAMLYNKTQELATHDELTGLYTKGYFTGRLNEEYKRSLRQSRSFALMMLDIDFFKTYNDTYGHTAGDMVLKTIGSTMMKSLEGANPLICRFGGEEFCLLLPGVEKAAALSLAEKLRREISQGVYTLRNKKTNVTVSIGVAAYPADAKDDQELLYKVDAALYEAKQKGRNLVVGIFRG